MPRAAEAGLHRLRGGRGALRDEETQILDLRLLRRRAAKAWKSFKLSAVSSFAYVETVGLIYAAKIVSDSLGLTRPAPDPNLDGLDAERDRARRAAARAATWSAAALTGFRAEQRLAMAEAVLKAMSMTEGFARARSARGPWLDDGQQSRMRPASIAARAAAIPAKRTPASPRRC